MKKQEPPDIQFPGYRTGIRWTGRMYRSSVIRSHRGVVERALKIRPMYEGQREILQMVRARFGELHQPIKPDLVGLWHDEAVLPAGPGPAPGDGLMLPQVRRSGEFVQDQPWLVPSVRTLIEWELRVVGRASAPPMLESSGLELADIWESLCAWATPLRRDRPGRYRLARRGAEALFGEYPWFSEWIDAAKGELPEPVRRALEGRRDVILDYARDTNCSCGPCRSRRAEVAEATRRFEARFDPRTAPTLPG